MGGYAKGLGICAVIYLGVSDPDRLNQFHETDPEPDPGSIKSAKIIAKFLQNHRNIIHFFQKYSTFVKRI